MSPGTVWWDGSVEPCDHLFDFCGGPIVSRIRVAVHSSVCHDENGVTDMIEDHQRIGEHEDGFRYPESGFLVSDLRDGRLEVADRVVREVPDRAAMELRESFDFCVFHDCHSVAQQIERVDFTVFGPGASGQYF